MAADNLALIDDFCDALWLEDGLAKNSLDAYRRDLRAFARWLELARPGAASLHAVATHDIDCLLYTSPSPRDGLLSRMPSSA